MSGDSTAVQAFFTLEGEIQPQRFEWHGKSVKVEAIGRCWVAEGAHWFNVSAMGGRLFQLRFDPDTLRWSITRELGPKLVV